MQRAKTEDDGITLLQTARQKIKLDIVKQNGPTGSSGRVQPPRGFTLRVAVKEDCRFEVICKAVTAFEA